MSGTCALIRSRDVAVDATLPRVPSDVSDSLEPARDKRDLRDNGDKETLANGTKIPCAAGHLKYLQKKFRKDILF